ncbi:MAG: IS630 family transposase, partial [Nitrospirota bacterium]|nr:IS630 family transposase [Nitrospirota bacterium]MEC4684005.1 IS630 family transposase [Nitrospirota bacterium]
ALTGARFPSRERLIKALQEFMSAYNQNAAPFVWRKREVKGDQLRNTITNLCN